MLFNNGDSLMTKVFNRKINNKIRLAITTPETTRPIGNRLGTFKINPIKESYEEATRSKLVRPPNMSNSAQIMTGDKFFNEEVETNQGYFDTISDETALSIQESEDILNALPDLRLAKQILISSILSPNDMISKEILYSCENNIFGDVAAPLLEVIKNYFDNDYKIKEKLADMLEKALFMEGSYISVILPESSVDDAINSNLTISNEASRQLSTLMEQPIGYVGNIQLAVSVESHLGISVVDNYELFKLPKLQNKIISDRVSSRIRPSKMVGGLESNIVNIYPNRKDVAVNILHIKTLKDLEKPTQGHPLEIIVPAEAFIPVYVPGDPTNHKGGFILLDSSGNPIRKRSSTDQQADMGRSYKTAVSELASGLITASADKMISVDSSKMTGGSVDHEYVSKVYNVLLERELKDKLTGGGVYTSNLDIGLANDIMGIMFARAAKRMETKLVYIPEELFNYMTFDYKDNGTGRSIIEKTKAISSLRMVQEMADALANIRNAIDHKDVMLNIDPADPDPMKTMSEMLHSIQRSTRTATPIGLLNLNDIASAFQKNGWNIRAQGHEGVPDMYVEYNQRTMNYPEPNKDYADRLRDQQIMGMGLSPDSVSGVMNADFATSILSSNIFLARDALEKQQVFSSHLTDKCQKYVRNSSILMNKLVSVIKENRKMISIDEDSKYSDALLAVLFVNNLTLSLPQPDLSKLDMQQKALQVYSSMLDDVLPHLISEELINENNMGTDISEAMNEIVGLVKSVLMRQYMVDNNIVPEAFKMLFVQDDNTTQMDLLRVQQNYLDNARPIFRDYIARSMKRKAHQEKMMEKLRENMGVEDEDDGYGSDGGFEDSDGGEDDGFGGDDDFGFGDDDLGADDEGMSDEPNDEDGDGIQDDFDLGL